MKLTDKAVEAAWRSWNGMHVGTAHDRLRAAIAAALPHLTDDGAALPVRRDGEGGLAATPSSPHPCGHEPLVGLYDDTRTLTIEGSVNHEVAVKLGDEEVFFTWADSFLAAAQCAAYEACEDAAPAIDPHKAAGAAVAAIVYNLPVDGFGDERRLKDYARIWGNASAKAVLALIAGAS